MFAFGVFWMVQWSSRRFLGEEGWQVRWSRYSSTFQLLTSLLAERWSDDSPFEIHWPTQRVLLVAFWNHRQFSRIKFAQQSLEFYSSFSPSARKKAAKTSPAEKGLLLSQLRWSYCHGSVERDANNVSFLITVPPFVRLLRLSSFLSLFWLIF